jgi:hypothetical protein
VVHVQACEQLRGNLRAQFVGMPPGSRRIHRLTVDELERPRVHDQTHIGAVQPPPPLVDQPQPDVRERAPDVRIHLDDVRGRSPDSAVVIHGWIARIAR